MNLLPGSARSLLGGGTTSTVFGPGASAGPGSLAGPSLLHLRAPHTLFAAPSRKRRLRTKTSTLVLDTEDSDDESFGGGGDGTRPRSGPAHKAAGPRSKVFAARPSASQEVEAEASEAEEGEEEEEEEEELIAEGTAPQRVQGPGGGGKRPRGPP